MDEKIRRFGKEKTKRLFLAASYSSPKLIKLGQTKPFCPLNHHNGGVWHIHPHFDYRGGNKNISFPLGKITHNLFFLFASYFSVEHRHSKIGKNLFGEFFVLIFYRLYLQHLPLIIHNSCFIILCRLYPRADHENLLSLSCFSTNEGVGLIPIGRINYFSDDRLPSP